MDAGHFDAKTAYAAVNTIRIDDLRPHIYRTHDDGKTWQEIVRGIPNDENVNVVREDPQRRGLLFAGTERGVYFSFDDGDQWQSLRLNLPATSVRDLIVKDDDLCIATHGRGFWILDNITPLRQLQPNDQKTALFKPQTAMRVRWNTNTDTPLPPDEPAGENPPEGAMIDYSLGEDARGPVTLEIKDSDGNVVRRYASTDPVPPEEERLKIPRYWVKQPRVLSSAPGLHRFFWDLHGQPLPHAEPQYPMTAIEHETAPQPTAPWMMPGGYSVSLTMGGQAFTQPLKLKMDPRVKALTADLQKQFSLSQTLYELREKLMPIGKDYEALAAALAEMTGSTGKKETQRQIAALRKNLEPLANSAAVRAGRPLELEVLGKVAKLFGDLQQVDLAPTPQQEAAVAELQHEAESVTERWKAIPGQISELNARLQVDGLAPIKLP